MPQESVDSVHSEEEVQLSKKLPTQVFDVRLSVSNSNDMIGVLETATPALPAAYVASKLSTVGHRQPSKRQLQLRPVLKSTAAYTATKQGMLQNLFIAACVSCCNFQAGLNCSFGVAGSAPDYKDLA